MDADNACVLLTGDEFNKLHAGYTFYKFLNNDLTHYGLEYKLGLNIDTKLFDSLTYEIQLNEMQLNELQLNESQLNAKLLSDPKYGIYFCRSDNCDFYCDIYGYKLASVSIPHDANVCSYVKRKEFKTDKIIINNIVDFKDVDDEFWINIIPDNGSKLEYVKNQTEELCKLAVQNDGYALEFVKNQTYDICKLAVLDYGRAIIHVKKEFLTFELCKLAVANNGHTLEDIKSNAISELFTENELYELCKIAVQHNGLALYYVDNQTEELCKLAVQQEGLALRFVENKTAEICRLAVEQNCDAVVYVDQLHRDLHFDNYY